MIYYGDATSPRLTEAYLIKGNPLTLDSSKYTITSTKLTVKKLLSPIDPSSATTTVRCLGLNYRNHAKELSLPLPKFPVLFYKPITAIPPCPNDDLVVPAIAQQSDDLGNGTETDYEAELVIVIGKPAKNVTPQNALDYVLGYTLGNDYSQRAWQTSRGGGQWSLGKMYDGWAPLGPCIVSSHVIQDPQNLQLSTKVNGEVVQNESTRDMIFSVKEAVSFLSQGTTLRPGDIIFTGTPAGVGAGRKPNLWLKHGDEVTVSLSNVGSITNRIVYEDVTTSKAKL